MNNDSRLPTNLPPNRLQFISADVIRHVNIVDRIHKLTNLHAKWNDDNGTLLPETKALVDELCSFLEKSGKNLSSAFEYIDAEIKDANQSAKILADFEKVILGSNIWIHLIEEGKGHLLGEKFLPKNALLEIAYTIAEVARTKDASPYGMRALQLLYGAVQMGLFETQPAVIALANQLELVFPDHETLAKIRTLAESLGENDGKLEIEFLFNWNGKIDNILAPDTIFNKFNFGHFQNNASLTGLDPLFLIKNDFNQITLPWIQSINFFGNNTSPQFKLASQLTTQLSNYPDRYAPASALAKTVFQRLEISLRSYEIARKIEAIGTDYVSNNIHTIVQQIAYSFLIERLAINPDPDATLSLKQFSECLTKAIDNVFSKHQAAASIEKTLRKQFGDDTPVHIDLYYGSSLHDKTIAEKCEYYAEQMSHNLGNHADDSDTVKSYMDPTHPAFDKDYHIVKISISGQEYYFSAYTLDGPGKKIAVIDNDILQKDPPIIFDGKDGEILKAIATAQAQYAFQAFGTDAIYSPAGAAQKRNAQTSNYQSLGYSRLTNDHNDILNLTFHDHRVRGFTKTIDGKSLSTIEEITVLVKYYLDLYGDSLSEEGKKELYEKLVTYQEFATVQNGSNNVFLGQLLATLDHAERIISSDEDKSIIKHDLENLAYSIRQIAGYKQ